MIVMGAWEQLDTEIGIEMELDELEKAINSCDGDYFDDVVEYLIEVKENIEKGSQEAVHLLATNNRSFQQQLLSDLSLHPYATGALSSSIVEEQLDEYSWLIGTTITHFYPLTVEYGRNEIRPVNAKVLFFYSLSGEPVFTKYVRPSEPKPFVAPAYENTLNEAENVVIECIGKVL